MPTKTAPPLKQPTNEPLDDVKRDEEEKEDKEEEEEEDDE